MEKFDLFSLEGKVAIVSGGSGKYGSQIVVGLAKAGTKVIIASRNVEKNKGFVDALRQKADVIICGRLCDNRDNTKEGIVLALK